MATSLFDFRFWAGNSRSMAPDSCSVKNEQHPRKLSTIHFWFWLIMCYQVTTSCSDLLSGLFRANASFFAGCWAHTWHVTLSGPDRSRHSSEKQPQEVHSQNSSYCPIWVWEFLSSWRQLPRCWFLCVFAVFEFLFQLPRNSRASRDGNSDFLLFWGVFCGQKLLRACLMAPALMGYVGAAWDMLFNQHLSCSHKMPSCSILQPHTSDKKQTLAPMYKMCEVWHTTMGQDVLRIAEAKHSLKVSRRWPNWMLKTARPTTGVNFLPTHSKKSQIGGIGYQ